MTRTCRLLLSLAAPALVLSTLACGAPPAPTRQAAAAANAVGIDTAGMDRAVNPGDDFFAFANGTWVRSTDIPPDRAAWGISGEIAAQAERDNRAILEHAASAPSSPEEKKLGDFYAAFMDEQTIEQRGLTPLQPTLDRIAAISDKQALAHELGSMLRADVDPLNFTNYHTDNLFGLWVAQDFNQPTRNTAYLLQGGLAMPDREYYVGTSDRMKDVREKYAAHVATVLRLAGATNAEATRQAARVIALETRIARTHATREQSVNVLKANNPWSRGDFATKAPGLDWPTFFQAASLDTQPSFVVWHPGAVTGTSALVASQPLDDWKLYLRYIVVNAWSPLLPKAFADEAFAFFGTTLSGTPQQGERWKRGVRAANAMGDALGRLYVQQHFHAESKKAVEAMVSDIKSAFAARIDRLDWMTAVTKAKAREKLQALIVGVGYPEQWRDYSALEVSRDDALGNAWRADLFYYRERIAKLSKPIDRNEWWMTPQTVNAVNLPIQNALNFPAAYLQPPHFDPRANAASNYAMIGSVIGHEISHSFDDQGAQFDGTGRLANWWTAEDAAHFSAAAEKLVAQFNAYKPFPDLAINGRQTLSENIADVAGLAAAYDAYRLSLHGTELPARDGFTGDQQFFIAFAQNWRTKMRDEMLRRIIITDGHAPAQYRAQTVRNLDPWYTAFGITSGAALYLQPADRVRIW